MSEGGEFAGLPLMLIVAPSTGRLRVLPPKAFVEGREWIEKGQHVASIEHTHADPDPVLAPSRGRLGGMMGRDGEPVKQGQPIAWMEAIPEGTTIMKPVTEQGA